MRTTVCFKSAFRILFSFFLFLLIISQFSPLQAAPALSEGTCTLSFHDYGEELLGNHPDGAGEYHITADTPVFLICNGDMLDGVGEFPDHASAPFTVVNYRSSFVGSFINVGIFEGTMAGEEISAPITCTGQSKDGFSTYSLRCVIKDASDGSTGILTVPVVTSPLEEGDIEEAAYSLKIMAK